MGFRQVVSDRVTVGGKDADVELHGRIYACHNS